MNTRFSVSVFDFREVADYLNAVFAQIKSERPAFSIRAWARQLKAGHPSSLTKTLAKEAGRRIPEKSVSNICSALGLNSHERAYFELLSMGKGRLSTESFELIRDLLQQAAHGNRP